MKAVTKNIPVHSTGETDFTLHTKTIEEATVLHKSNTEQGLTMDDAKERLERHGLNTIAEAIAISPFKILANQFKSPIVFCCYLPQACLSGLKNGWMVLLSYSFLSSMLP